MFTLIIEHTDGQTDQVQSADLAVIKKFLRRTIADYRQCGSLFQNELPCHLSQLSPEVINVATPVGYIKTAGRLACTLAIHRN